MAKTAAQLDREISAAGSVDPVDQQIAAYHAEDQ
jgi:hypothetical protein